MRSQTPMAGRRFQFAGLTFGLTDVVTLGGLLTLILLAMAFNGRMAHPVHTIGIGLAFAAAYVVMVAILPKIRAPLVRFLIRTAVVQFTFVQVYQLGSDLQLLFFPWQDNAVLALEKAVFGFQPLVAIQKLYSVPLNEWMFFVYVFYLVIYPSLGAYIFFKHGEEANEDYLFHLGLVNLVCAIGFILFPVASPMHWLRLRAFLTKPLTAGAFGSVAEWIRSNVHQAGGSVPSPHCAVATVMWFMSRKYTRHGFVGLAPIVVSLYISTVYGRFHYTTDMVIGIAAGLLVLLIAPVVARAWNARPTRAREA